MRTEATQSQRSWVEALNGSYEGTLCKHFEGKIRADFSPTDYQGMCKSNQSQISDSTVTCWHYWYSPETTTTTFPNTVFMSSKPLSTLFSKEKFQKGLSDKKRTTKTGHDTEELLKV